MPLLKQDHIHLSRTLQPAGEKAPDMRWKVRLDGYLPVHTVIETQERTLTGRLVVHRTKREGQVVRLTDFKYIVRVDDYDDMTADERYDALLAMQGEFVYLVDIRHCNNGLDHTAFVRPMYMKAIADVNLINPQMTPLYITIELQDNSLA